MRATGQDGGGDEGRGEGDLIDLRSGIKNARDNLEAKTSPGAGLATAEEQAEAAYADLIVTSIDFNEEELTDEEIDALTKRTQDGGTEVVAAKAGKGSATLSMAYAGALFGDACLRAKNGEAGVVECSYVESDVVPGVEFFATKVSLGREGVEKIHGTGALTAYEQKGLDDMMEELKGSIQKGLDFAKGA